MVDAMTKPSDAADGTAAIAAIVVMPCDMGSPSCRVEESPVHSAADEDAEREALCEVLLSRGHSDEHAIRCC